MTTYCCSKCGTPIPERASEIVCVCGANLMLTPFIKKEEWDARQARHAEELVRQAEQQAYAAAQPFRDAIDARLNDPLPLLVFADWLDDHGDAEGAKAERAAAAALERKNKLCEYIDSNHSPTDRIDEHDIYTLRDAKRGKTYAHRVARDYLKDSPAEILVYSHQAPTAVGFKYSKEDTGIVYYRPSQGGKYSRSWSLRSVRLDA